MRRQTVQRRRQASIRKSVRRTLTRPIGSEFDPQGRPIGIRQASRRAAAAGRRAAVSTQAPILPRFPLLKQYTPAQAATIRRARDRVAADLYTRHVVGFDTKQHYQRGGGYFTRDKTEYRASRKNINRYLQGTHSERVLGPYRRAGAFKVPVKTPSGETVLTKSSRAFDTPTPHGGRIQVSGTQGAENVRKTGVVLLEQTTRPGHAIASGTRAAIKGENIPKAVGRGFANKDKYTFSDVLAEAGVENKYARAIGGFGLDVVTDPTTYLTLGTSSVGRNVSTKALKKKADRVYQQGLKKGLSKPEAAARSREAVAKAQQPNKGLTVGMRALGREARAPGVTRGTAAASRRVGTSRAATRLRNTRAVQTGGQLLRPDFKPKGVSTAAWEKVRAAERASRAITQTGQRVAQNRAVAYFRAADGKDQAKIIQAVETGNAKDLTKEERAVARAIRTDNRTIEALERQAGVGAALSPTGEARFYFSHKPEADLLANRTQRELPSGKSAKLGSSRQREKRDTVANLKARGDTAFSEDIGLVMGNRMTRSAVARGNAHLISELVDTGKKFRPGLGQRLKEGEALYAVSRREVPRRLSSKDEIAAAFKAGYGVRALNKNLVDRTLATAFPKEGALRDFGRWYDRALQGKFKTLVTVPNPQYHLTNLYGDLFNSYLADTRIATGSSGVHSARALRRFAKREAAKRTLAGSIPGSEKGLKIGGKRVTYDELIEEAEKAGAVRSGFVGRDIPEVLDAAQKELAEKVGQGRIGRRTGPVGRAVAKNRVTRTVAHPIDALRNMSQYREDFVRLATYIEARKAGLSAEKASERVAKYHFDYGDLTDFERTVLRRVFPFYTFTARNTPLQVEKLISRPGKYATVQKLREEAQKASGLPEGYEADLADYEQRGLPIPTKGVPLLSDLTYPKLPLTDIGRLAPDLTEQQGYLIQMLSPFLSTPLEYPANFSYFFREDIDPLYSQSGGREHSLVPGPSFLGKLPKAWRRKLGVEQYRTDEGRKVWGIPKRLNYMLGKFGPAASLAVRATSSAPSERGRTGGDQLLGFLTGLKTGPFDPKKNKLNKLYSDRDLWRARADNLRRKNRDRTRDGTITPEYRRVLDKANAYQRQIDRLNPKGPAKKPDPIDNLLRKYGRGGSSQEGQAEKLLEKYGKGGTGTGPSIDELLEKYGAAK